MDNIYIIEDAGESEWYLAYKDPIQGEMIKIDEEDALKLLVLKNSAVKVE